MNHALFVLLCIAAIITGISCYVADTWLNVEYIIQSSNDTGPIITTVVIAAGSALSFVVASAAWKMKLYSISIMCFIGFVAAITWSAPVSIERIGSIIDAKMTNLASHNQKATILSEAYNSAKEARSKEQSLGGCKSNCQKLMDRENDLLAQLLAVGTKKDIETGSRLAYSLPFIDAKTVQMIIPVSAVIALTSFMNGLLAFGVMGLMTRYAPKEPELIIPEVLVPVANNDPVVNFIFNNQDGSLSITELANATNKPVPYMSTYVKQLEEQGIVKRIKDGRRVLVSPNKS